MKRVGTFLPCLLAGLSLAAAARADDLAVASPDLATPDNPYGTIITRNIFGLLPPPTNPPDVKPPDPPVKITPNGITDIFGAWQVLFKATLPGPPPHEQSYRLSEGQQQDDIEVVKIDQRTKIVTFNNHGIEQNLPLANTPTSGGSGGAGQGGSGPAFPNFPGRSGAGGGGAAAFITSIGTQGGGFRSGTPSGMGGNPGGYGGNNAYGGANNGIGFGNANTPRTYQPPPSVMTPDEASVLIEVQREQMQQRGIDANAIIPPTPLTQMIKQELNGGENPPPTSP